MTEEQFSYWQRCLLKYRYKNEMFPMFFSGIFLSSSINILTTKESRVSPVEMTAMCLMFFSCCLFFIEATKIHELREWYARLSKQNKNEKYFFNSTPAWDFFRIKDFYKIILPLLPFFAWLIGFVSFLMYFSFDTILFFYEVMLVSIKKIS